LRRQFKWPVVVATFIAAFVAIYAFNWWRQENLVIEPLTLSLKEIEGVEEVNISVLRDRDIIDLELAPVDNLATAYQAAEDIIISYYGEEDYQLNILDERDEHLEEAYWRVHITLREGQRLGNYSFMSAETARLLEQDSKITAYRLYVDGQRIYLHLSAGDRYLYEVLEIEE